MNGRVARLRKVVIWVGLLCTTTTSVLASPISSEEARKAVSKWVTHRRSAHMNARLGGSVRSVDSVPDANGRDLFHVVNLDGGGFVVTSADDDLTPIIAFSESNELVQSDENPLWCILREDLLKRMTVLAAARAKPQPRLMAAASGAVAADDSLGRAEANADWADLLRDAPRLQASGVSTISDVRVAPLVKSKWNQGDDGNKNYCYNLYTYNHYACGCTATAVAQVMRYHEYPKGNVPRDRYVWSRKNWYEYVMGGASGPEGFSGPYDWDLMVLDPKQGCTDAERDAIGRLCFDVGVVSCIDWGPNGSGGWPAITTKGLMDTFGYASAAACHCGYADSFDASTFKRTVYPNLDGGFPVVLAIFSSRGGDGHSVVADGYGMSGSTIYTHINVGWGGSNDAWYSLTGIMDYNLVSEIAYNIFPTQTGELLTGRVTDANGAAIAGATVTAVRGTDRRTTTTSESGIYSFIVPSVTKWSVTATAGELGSRSVVASVGTTRSDSIYVERTYRYGTTHEYDGMPGNSWGNDISFGSDSKFNIAVADCYLSKSSVHPSQSVRAFDEYATVNVQLTLKGVGTTETDRSFDVIHELLAYDGSVEASMTTEAPALQLSNGGEIHCALAPDFMQGLNDGCHFYRCRFNTKKNVAESDYTDNACTLQFKIDKQSVADMVANTDLGASLAWISATPDGVYEPKENLQVKFDKGEPIYVHAGFKNEGNKAISGPVEVAHEVYTEGGIRSDCLVARYVQTCNMNVSPGEIGVFEVVAPDMFKTLPLGRYYYWVEINPGRKTDEKDYSNNCPGAFWFEIKKDIPNIQYDPTLCWISTSPDDIVEPRENLQTTFHYGETIYVHSGFKNTGYAPLTGDVEVTHEIRKTTSGRALVDSYVQTCRVDRVAVGETVHLASVAPEMFANRAKSNGQYYYYCHINKSHKIEEMNYDDNVDVFWFEFVIQPHDIKADVDMKNACVKLSWPKLTSASYKVERAESPDGAWQHLSYVSSSGSPAYTDYAILGGHTYAYRIQSRYSGDKNAYSTEDVSCTIPILLSVTPVELAVPAVNGVSEDVLITANCTWELAFPCDWISACVTNGVKNKAVSFSCADNFSGASRTGDVMLYPTVDSKRLDGDAVSTVRFVQPTFPVPSQAWLQAHPGLVEALGTTDPKKIALSPSPGTQGSAGKMKSDGVTPMYVWEDILAGTDPLDSTSFLRALIDIRNGRPVVTWKPDLSKDDDGVSRCYTTRGSTDLQTWDTVTPGQELKYNFFKISVSMP